MITLRVAAHLVPLLAADVPALDGRRAEVALRAGGWSDVVEQLRVRCPCLADRALEPSGAIGRGFVLVVNNEVIRRPDASLALSAGDEICLLAAFAGG